VELGFTLAFFFGGKVETLGRCSCIFNLWRRVWGDSSKLPPMMWNRFLSLLFTFVKEVTRLSQIVVTNWGSKAAPCKQKFGTEPIFSTDLLRSVFSALSTKPKTLCRIFTLFLFSINWSFPQSWETESPYIHYSVAPGDRNHGFDPASGFLSKIGLFDLHCVYWFSYRSRCKPSWFYISGLPLEFGYVWINKSVPKYRTRKK
jgi:hypothetical protein